MRGESSNGEPIYRGGSDHPRAICRQGKRGAAFLQGLYCKGNDVIFIGIGGNLPSRFGSPRESCAAALVALAAHGVHPVRVSRFWRTAPVPVSDQPWFVNAVAAVATDLSPTTLLAVLNEIEEDFGRVRGVRDAARGLDLDLLDYRGWQSYTDRLTLPHPRLHQRAFVLYPLADIAADWCHPLTRVSLARLIEALPGGQVAEVMT